MANFNQNKDNILYQLKASDYNIRLSTKLLQGIETRLKKLIIFIDRNKKNVRSLVSEQEQLKKQYAARLVDAYKTPPITQLDILFNAKTVDEYLRFTKYREVIDSEETRLLKELATKQRKTEAAQKSLQRDINKQVAEKEKQKKQLLKLAADKKKQKSLFKSISSSISKTKKAISEKEKSRLNMRRMIKDLTTSSKVRSNKFIPNKKFSKNKGKFPWPVKGKVTRRFGKIKHPKFAIYEQNDGIDISARKGSIVSNLHEGVVLNVFYQLGAGNTIIIDHGYEIFTVYTHLEDIVVKVNQHISSGAAIGTVGNSGTIDGKAKLHFEIWVKNKAVNPAKWLR
jgi:septal ring factor EnvC (AmiA/AmiB activator)